MEILISLLFVCMGVIIAAILTKESSVKRKYKVWGLMLILVIAPFLSFSLGLVYANLEQNGWAAVLMFILFPILFLIGLIILLMGIFRKGAIDNG